MPSPVLLYNPKAVFYDMPLALLAVASALDRSRFEPVIVDGRLQPDPIPALTARLDQAVCLGLTVLTGAPLRDALDITRKVKALRPDLPVIWGGWHPSLFPEQPLRECPEVDITVQGQGETALRQITIAIADGTPLSEIPGICYRDGDRIIRNRPRAMENMDELPPVDYGLIDVEAYFKAKGRRQFDYISSTGCFFRCAFCADPHVFQRKWSAISPERMGEEIAQWVQRYQVEDLNFQDETFFTYRERAVAVAQEFIRRGLKISWAGTLRADQGSRMSEEEFAICVKSGLRRVLIGVESGDPEMVKWMKKDIKLEQVWEMAERCARHGVHAIFPFIVGFPGETAKQREASLSMAAKLRRMSPGFTTPIFFFKPYPGSDITRQVEAEGYKLPSTLEEWADFDYIGSNSPWLDQREYGYIERFRFYNQLSGGQPRWFTRPLRGLARWRVQNRRFGMPFEKALADRLRPGPRLS